MSRPRVATSLAFATLLLAVPNDAQTLRLDEGVYRVTANEVTLPQDRPFDIGGRTIRFDRVNATEFRVRSGSLEYESSIG